jgi:hypothetical protein
MVEGLHSESNMEIANDRRLKIGELARQTGLSIKTIRYYERRGLLEQPPRAQGGYRLYGPEEVARLRFVQRAKLLRLTLEEISGDGRACRPLQRGRDRPTLGVSARDEAQGDGAQDGRAIGLPPEPPLLPGAGLRAVGWSAAD